MRMICRTHLHVKVALALGYYGSTCWLVTQLVSIGIFKIYIKKFIGPFFLLNIRYLNQYKEKNSFIKTFNKQCNFEKVNSYWFE